MAFTSLYLVCRNQTVSFVLYYLGLWISKKGHGNNRKIIESRNAIFFNELYLYPKNGKIIAGI